MLKRILLGAFVVILSAGPALAQEPKAEIGVFAGWVFSDGVSTSTNFVIPNVGTFNRVDPKDSFGWGFDVGVMIGPNAEVGFMYTQQPTKLQAGGTSTLDIGDMSTHTYHGTFTYNFGSSNDRIRPYLMGGLGGTSYGDTNYTRTNGATGTINGESRFTSTWGAGVKIYGASKIGARFGVRWTPTYVKSDASGWWCDPYWGCYVTATPQYSNQIDINGGVTVRF